MAGPLRSWPEDGAAFVSWPSSWDPKEFERFYRDNAGRQVSLLQGFGIDRDEAAEAVQDAMVELARRWGEIDHPQAWVRKVARRKAVDLLRRRKRVRLTDGRDVLDSVSTDVADSTMAIYDAERLFAHLPGRQRAVMLLAFEGWTAEEIGRELGLAASTVRNHQLVARRMLRRLLDEEAQLDGR